MNKTLVLYVFHEYNIRVEYFIKNAIFKDPDIDFLFISNNRTNKFHVPEYVKILMRDNIGYDFGGWSHGLLTNSLYNKYNKFIFVNSSVIGPFTPQYYTGKWTDIYINGLHDNIKLFGSTINDHGNPMTNSHVQSYIFSMDIITLKYLINCNIFSVTDYANTFSDAINKKEILMSRKVIDNGWNIGSLLPLYKGIDFRSKKQSYYNCFNFMGDIISKDRYYNTWNLYDLVFTKGNRDISISNLKEDTNIGVCNKIYNIEHLEEINSSEIKHIVYVDIPYKYGVNENAIDIIFNNKLHGITSMLTNHIFNYDPVPYSIKYLYSHNMRVVCKENDIMLLSSS